MGRGIVSFLILICLSTLPMASAFEETDQEAPETTESLSLSPRVRAAVPEAQAQRASHPHFRCVMAHVADGVVRVPNITSLNYSIPLRC